MASRRDLPSVDRVLLDERIAGLIARHSRPIVVAAVRDALAVARSATRAGTTASPIAEIVSDAVGRIEARDQPSLRRVINGTGVIIQTNLGRAPLSREAAEAAAAIGSGYSTLEYDVERGERGSRTTHMSRLLTTLTGAEAALAVNNNAAAVLLALAALARGRDVIIARGQLVEIGGGFRIPDVLAQSGARLVEVGTTNRTYARDYVEAIGDSTAAILRVHPSNFRVVGFTHESQLSELAEIARDRGILLIDDLGSGSLIDTSRFGLEHEPTIADSITEGADVVCFSGDKLLGGPQAGIIVGRSREIERVARHPFARAMRLDKMTIAAMEATLRHYERGEAIEKVPVWRMIGASVVEIEARARTWGNALADRGINSEVRSGRSAVGGGSLPGATLPTFVLALTSPIGLDRGSAFLRGRPLALIARVEHDRLVIDPRTIDPADDGVVLNHLLELSGL
ncbi:MAG: L-seryl-tRNA(Sec) selenium transferase [Chloroflexota bacterium]|nr:MAG: L-seryl-tRNA(Sec) selenium transferase [Chloroflexota bacterium]